MPIFNEQEFIPPPGKIDSNLVDKIAEDYLASITVELPYTVIGLQHRNLLWDKEFKQALKALSKEYRIVVVDKHYSLHYYTPNTTIIEPYRLRQEHVISYYDPCPIGLMNNYIFEKFSPVQTAIFLSDVAKPNRQTDLIKKSRIAGLPVHLYVLRYGWQ